MMGWSKTIGIMAVSMMFGSGVMAGGVLLDQNFNSDNPREGWEGGGEVAAKDGIDKSGCLKFDLQPGSEEKSMLLTKNLDVEKFKGKTIKVEAMMKGLNLSQPAKSYLGPKLMIYYKDATKHWVDQPKASGTFDWKKFEFTVPVPSDVTELSLVVGLQDCTGVLWIDQIKITEADATSGQ